MLERVLNSAREHILLTSVQHGLGGFGLAVILQVYLQGQSFAPLWLGWVFVAFSVMVNAYDLIRGMSSSSTHVTPTRTYSSTLSTPVT